jgi:hypothetical protein
MNELLFLWRTSRSSVTYRTSRSSVSYNNCCALKWTKCWTGLLLSYLYLPLTHLSGGQSCATWVLSLGWQAGNRCKRDCAGNAGTPAQLTIGMSGPMDRGLEMPYIHVHKLQINFHQNFHFTVISSTVFKFILQSKLSYFIKKSSHLLCHVQSE